MIEKIKEAIVENKNPILYSLLGLSVFSGYFFYGRYELAEKHGLQLRNKKNKLDTTFQQLLKDSKQPKIVKIVFTEAQKSSGNYRKIVIDKIKQAFPKKDLGVLINCAPKKLFQAGCQSFIQTFDHDDEQYVDYVVNLLKQELLIEDSFQKIEKVSQMNNPNRFVMMICDNNCLDLLRITSQKGVYLDERILKNALDKLNIKLADLYDMYSYVIHFEEDAETETEQQKEENIFIQKIWGDRGFRGYYQKFKYDNKKSKSENVNVVVKYLHEKIRQYQIETRQQNNQPETN